MSESSEVQELQEKDVIIDRITKLFGNDVAHKFQDEEITHFLAIADLLKREADASIFRNLGLKYGSAVRFKTEFSNTGPVRELSSSPRLKPTMGEMSGFNPEMKRLYLSKRKKVGLLATQKWGAGNFPKFNTPEMKTQLKAFASDIEGECSIPEIGFTSDAICQHIQDYFNEQRRYKKRNGQQPVREHVKRKTSAISQSCGKRFRATCTLDKTPPEQDNAAQNLTDSGESLSTLSPYDSSDSESPMTPTGASSPSEIKVPSTLTSSQEVIKAVFGKLLTREKSVDILKSKFDVKKSNLTNLTPTVK